jgi:MFS family permease
MWLAPIAATTQDLVLPRMRGTAAAIFLLGTNIIGLGMGPYVVGLISDVTGDLRFAMLSVLAMFPIILLLLILLIKRVPEMERTVLERARAAGEPV